MPQATKLLSDLPPHMKQFAIDNDSKQSLVQQSLQGLVASTQGLVLLPSNVVVSQNLNDDKVTLVSGGGSGHEPLHAGFIGPGLLDGVAVGQIFASPTCAQVSTALSAVESKKGTLVIVKNYTGDVLHFGKAVEQAKAAGRDVRMVVVGDDVAVARSQGRLVGRRGLAGVALVHKIAGAAAEKGQSLESVAKIAEKTSENLVTAGCSLDHCTVPGRAFESELKENEYSLGLGIHNEPGFFKDSPLPSFKHAVDSLLPLLLDKNDKERAFVNFEPQDKTVLLVNNLGGLSQFELNYATSVALQELKNKYSIEPVRTLSKTFVTAFNNPGFSLTLLNLTKAGDVLDLLDAKASAPGWSPGSSTAPKHQSEAQEPTKPSAEISSGVTLPKSFEGKLRHGIKLLIDAEPEITRYDQVAGDGDCGETLKVGGEAIITALDKGSVRLSDAAAALSDFADIVDDAMGGTSGGLYSIYLTALASGVTDMEKGELDVPKFAKAASKALDVLYRYTKARVGDRTLVDALEPFVKTLADTSSLEKAVASAKKGAEGTAELRAGAGRAAYVQQDHLAHEKVPDPGAFGLAKLLEGFTKSSD